MNVFDTKARLYPGWVGNFTDMTAMLHSENLSHYFGGLCAVSDFRLEVGEGELVGLIGPNGAGKSSILGAVSGLLPVPRGAITFAGEDLVRLPAHRRVERGIAHAPEGRSIFGNLTVLENLRLAAYARTDGEVAADLGRSSPSSPAWPSAASSAATPSRAASSRCWLWAGPS